MKKLTIEDIEVPLEFTPGPWMVGVLDRGHGHESYALCTLDGTPVEPTLENITIQAAAPEMYEALEEAREVLANYSDVIDGPNGPLPNRAMYAEQIIKAVLAKAEGK